MELSIGVQIKQLRDVSPGQLLPC